LASQHGRTGSSSPHFLGFMQEQAVSKRNGMQHAVRPLLRSFIFLFLPGCAKVLFDAFLRAKWPQALSSLSSDARLPRFRHLFVFATVFVLYLCSCGCVGLMELEVWHHPWPRFHWFWPPFVVFSNSWMFRSVLSLECFVSTRKTIDFVVGWSWNTPWKPVQRWKWHGQLLCFLVSITHHVPK
jgi:hypothetical protein